MGNYQDWFMNLKRNKEGKIYLSFDKNDFVFTYFSGTGKGGSNRNKHMNCCRCQHPPSGAMGTGQEERDLPQNKKLAFERCANTVLFKSWANQKLIEIEDGMTLEEKVNKDLEEKNLIYNTKDGKGKWVETKKEDLKGEENTKILL